MTETRYLYPKPPRNLQNDPEFAHGMENILDQEFYHLLTKVKDLHLEIDENSLHEAFQITKDCQSDIYRNTGANSVSHPLGLCHELIDNPVFQNEYPEFFENPEILTHLLASALLHDAKEEAMEKDTYSETLEDQIFDLSPEISETVELVTKPIKKAKPSMSLNDYQTLYLQQFPDIDHAFLTYLQIQRLDDSENHFPPQSKKLARLVKIADITHNLKTLHGFDQKRRNRFLAETEKLWIPKFKGKDWDMPHFADFLQTECDRAKTDYKIITKTPYEQN